MINKTIDNKIPFGEALIYWFKLGFISFGGPAGQISMMHQELVEKRRWISEHRFLHALNYTMVLPGPEAQQLATYIGWLMHGVWGGIAAGILFVIPSLFILSILTYIYLSFGDLPSIEGVLYGIKPAVTAIVVFAAYRIGSRALGNNILRTMALLAFIAIFVLAIPFPYIVLMAGLIGIAGGMVMPDKFSAGGGHAASDKAYGPAVIDDDTPIPDHAKFRWSRFAMFLLVGLSIGAAVMALLTINYGWDGVLTQMSWFFTKAALVTFGGAYAVLPYVYQGGVEQYGWLTGTQMIDGLALGETTPGPLIMVVAFVGFVGAWTKEIFGPEMLPLAGLAGASVATLFTFLPSFLFILLGGPMVEATRGDMKFTAPLTGITAAVVGVILNLAVFFAYHVLWPEGMDATFEWFAALIGLGAFIALFRYKIGIITVIAASAGVGLTYSLIL
ncbi:MAG: chromate efflux transporter [Thiotrichales bacterium]|jgi:chromate transporter|nr:chromate efflux transporter [Thiotrichales bacterium]MBT3614237.1 chromate efflux transporter [Thiotrichales bacterium]MBT3751899.1 chromate efflux transporter [Thiotrichales bacterium]MBT3837157.1 chromate efflux transporter [Thiotrichales bacterium]MBT4153013.1 chromate efflux transporter [Thiotrichales bacterium]